MAMTHFWREALVGTALAAQRRKRASGQCPHSRTREKRTDAGWPTIAWLRRCNAFSLSFRQVVARTILETLRAVVDEKDDVEAVLNVMNRLADDQGKEA